MPTETPPSPRVRRYVLTIDGMRTVHCVRAVAQALAGVPGARGAEVSLGRAELVSVVPIETATVAEWLAVAGYRLRAMDPLRGLPLLTEQDQTPERLTPSDHIENQ